MSTAIGLSGVTAGWVQDRPVVRDLTIALDGPGIAAVIGPNGTGKSTLVELVSGYLRPWEGTVEVGGLPAHSPGARRARRICRTTPALYGLMTVRDHLVLSARSAGDDPERQLDRSRALGLAPWFDENAGTLSSGTAKKLWYVFCTAGEFDLAVIDEPFNALDAEAVGRVVAELATWAADRTVVVVAHHPPADLVIDTSIDLAPWAVRRA